MDSGIVQKGIFVSAPRSSGSAHSRGVRSKGGHRLESSVPRYSTKGKTMAHSDILSQPDRGLSPDRGPARPILAVRRPDQKCPRRGACDTWRDDSAAGVPRWRCCCPAEGLPSPGAPSSSAAASCFSSVFLHQAYAPQRPRRVREQQCGVTHKTAFK